MTEHKTTKKHYKFFKKECRYWINKFNLNSWIVWFYHGDSEKLPDALAWFMGTDWKGRVITLGLAKNWKDLKPTKKIVSRCAFHEVCELLMYRTAIIGKTDAKPTEIDEVEEQVHVIIRSMEHAIWKPYWK